MHLIFTLSKKTMTELKALLKTTPQYINLLSSHGIKTLKIFLIIFQEPMKIGQAFNLSIISKLTKKEQQRQRGKL